MTIYEQKMFKRFRMVNPSTCTSDLNEDRYVFIFSYNGILHNLRLVESHGFDYTMFLMIALPSTGAGIILMIGQLNHLQYHNS